MKRQLKQRNPLTSALWAIEQAAFVMSVECKPYHRVTSSSFSHTYIISSNMAALVTVPLGGLVAAAVGPVSLPLHCCYMLTFYQSSQVYYTVSSSINNQTAVLRSE
jgi:hypothetical protein